jgi:hypothetical protein
MRITIITNKKSTRLPDMTARNWDRLKRAIRLDEFCKAVGK